LHFALLIWKLTVNSSYPGSLNNSQQFLKISLLCLTTFKLVEIFETACVISKKYKSNIIYSS